MKVLVCGSRTFSLDSDFTDGKSVVWERLDALHDREEFHLIAGGARGPDEWARDWAEQSRVNHSIYYADWEKHGKRAGIIRNIAMLKLKPDLVLAFWDGDSSGTMHTIETARAWGIPVEVIHEV